MKGSTEPRNVQLPLSWNGEGTVPISVFRSSWSDPRATFVGLKAGSPSASHGHMDIGSFVLDSDGVRWATDLGSEDYYRIESRNMELWNRAQNSDRWTIFRLSNFGHNTLVIDNQLQVASADANIVEFSDHPDQPYSVADLTAVYSGHVASARRGVMLLPSREVLIQDQLTGLRPGSHVRWGMVTTGAPETGHDKNALILRQNGEKLTLSVRSPANASWDQIDTAAPKHEWDSPNPETRMVFFETPAPESGKLTLAVVATPGTCNSPVAKKIRIVPLENWGRQP